VFIAVIDGSVMRAKNHRRGGFFVAGVECLSDLGVGLENHPA
jgi:hypothetical protein